MTTKTLLTAEEYLSMPDDGYTELVRGEIVEVPTTLFREGAVAASVTHVLGTWTVERGVGAVCSNGTAVQTEYEPDTIRAADVLYYAADRIPSDPDKVGDKPPTLCVEVISPSNGWSDVLGKIREYLDVGVDEVWIVHPLERWVEIHVPQSSSIRLTPGEDLADRPALPGFATLVDAFFRGL